jgi:predicted RNA-binding Zn-ribbon protein involved in translation (DUF1610 family)
MTNENEIGYKQCPRCNEEKLHPIDARNSLSRKDNETYICSDCGMDEALGEFLEKGVGEVINPILEKKLDDLNKA